MPQRFPFTTWPRVSECRKCGGDRCREEPISPKRSKFKIYCWRYGKLFFVDKSTLQIVGESKATLNLMYSSNYRGKEDHPDQITFNFGLNDNHLDAISS